MKICKFKNGTIVDVRFKINIQTFNTIKKNYFMLLFVHFKKNY
jgi:hypothetical protein